ncbi:MAG: leucine-rich repeat protein, partial [Clostridiales bacterium]|nr:leucine-rich repeat protein [Clostridiales bacterium]
AKLNTIVIGTNASVSDFGDFSAYPAALESFTSIVDDRAFANCSALRHFAVYTSKKTSDLTVSAFAANLAFTGCTDITYYGWGTDNIISDYATLVAADYKNLSPVIEEVKSVSVAPKSVFMALKETVQLTVTVLPNASSEYGEDICSFISSNTEVATVSDSGVIKAVGLGTAVISVISINNLTDTCTVTVAERVEGDYVYHFLNDGTVEIAQFNSGVTGVVEIPDTIAGRTVTSIGDYAFKDCSGIREIKLPDTITKIGTGAFYGCIELAVFKTSSNLKTIGSAAFYGCSSLAFVDLLASVSLTGIGDAAFRDCTSLAAVFLPESITTIGKDAFVGDTALKIFMTESDLVLDTAITYFDSSAFLTIYSKADNSNLSSYAAIKKIDFSNLIDVTELVLSVNSTSLIIGESISVSAVATIGGSEFSNYDKAAFAVDNKNVVILKDGKLTAVGAGTAKLYAIAPNGLYDYIDIVVKAGISGDYEYRLIDNMEEAEIIGFTNDSVKSTTVSDSVNFNGTDIPVTSIGNAAFENTALTSIEIGANITSVNGASFDCAYALEEINVKPSNKNYMDIDGVLFNAFGTTLIKYPASKDGYTYDIPSSITNIGNYAFKDNKYLTYINFPSKLARIGDHSFESMEMLMSAVLPSQVTSIGSFAFAYNTKLDYIVIP